MKKETKLLRLLKSKLTTEPILGGCGHFPPTQGEFAKILFRILAYNFWEDGIDEHNNSEGCLFGVLCLSGRVSD
jgi:hypothetical protein